MTLYRSLHGDSKVVSYEALGDSIIVVFRSDKHSLYLYNSFCLVKVVVEWMKALAMLRHGFKSHISSVVKDNFARK